MDSRVSSHDFFEMCEEVERPGAGLEPVIPLMERAFKFPEVEDRMVGEVESTGEGDGRESNVVREAV
jgi:hypothetical protein